MTIASTFNIKILFIVGVCLLGLNLAGFFIPLESNHVDKSHTQIAKNVNRKTQINKLLKLNSEDTETFVNQTNQLVNQSMISVPVEHYGPVPLWENYILYLLRFIKPSTYANYEYCSYRKAIERGVGQCGQQSMTVVDYLQRHGFDTAFLELPAHSMAAVRLKGDSWYALDPTIGESFPITIPDQLISTNRRNGDGSIEIDPDVLEIFPAGPIKRITVGGANARYPRACIIEQLSYLLKWILPIFLTLPLIIFRISDRAHLKTLTTNHQRDKE